MVPLIPLSSLQTAPAKHGTPAFDFFRIRAFWAISSRHLRAPRCSNLSRTVKKRDKSVLVSLLSFPTRPPAQQKMKNSLDATFRFDFYPKIRVILPMISVSVSRELVIHYLNFIWSWIGYYIFLEMQIRWTLLFAKQQSSFESHKALQGGNPTFTSNFACKR